MDLLLTHLSLKTQLIESVVERLRELPYPTKTPFLLAEVIRQIACSLSDEMWRQAADVDPQDGNFRIQLKFSVKYIETLTAHLRFVERATTRLTPWSLILPLERISEKLHPGCRFLIRPQWNYNFTILEIISAYKKLPNFVPVNDIVQNVLGQGGTDAITSLYIVGFPYLERLSVLRHVLFGHEIGHPVEAEYFQNHPDTPFMRRMHEEVAREVEASRTPDVDDLFLLKNQIDMLRSVRIVRRRALAELICDTVCLRLFGPAAIFALFEFCQTGDLDTVHDEPTARHYPPWRYRLRNACEIISDEWFNRFLIAGSFEARTRDALRAHLQHIRDTVAPNTDTHNLNTKPITRIAYQSVAEALPQAREFVDARLNAKGFSMDLLVGRVHSLLLRQLEHWIPPDHYIAANRTEVPADLFAILNVGWIRFITDFSGLERTASTQQREDYLQRLNALNRLLLKAVENSTVREAWKKRRPATAS